MKKFILAVAAIALAATGIFAQTKSAPIVGTFKDNRDGKIYKTAKIGTQTWMAQNLNYEAKRSKCYEDSPDSCAKYGRMYDWVTANDACPAGWHLPSNEEWKVLIDYAGGEAKGGTNLKLSTGWNSDKWTPAGTNKYGFSALAGGGGNIYSDKNINCSGSDNVCFGLSGTYGYWWSATEYNANRAITWRMYFGGEYVSRNELGKDTEFYSVRCIQNENDVDEYKNAMSRRENETQKSKADTVETATERDDRYDDRRGKRRYEQNYEDDYDRRR